MRLETNRDAAAGIVTDRKQGSPWDLMNGPFEIVSGAHSLVVLLSFVVAAVVLVYVFLVMPLMFVWGCLRRLFRNPWNDLDAGQWPEVRKQESQKKL